MDGGHVFHPGRVCGTGESLEQAVAREVMEEAGVKITNIRYHSSQPWPFPSSLMLGFYADALNEDFHRNDDELQNLHADAIR